VKGILEIKPKDRKFNILKDFLYIRNINDVLNLNIKTGDKLVLKFRGEFVVTSALKTKNAFYLDVKEI
jgi:hypothetical protein